jgi:diaminohydroxyphosphoribosylaminopyrimidine deaminase/5-amino-6-(5-phosphoribosylamino)uracil reductase
VRFVIDQNNRIPKDHNLFNNQVKTILFSKSKTTLEKENTIFEVIDFELNIAEQITTILYQHQIQSVIIEGGRQTLQTFIDANLWDEARIFIGTASFKEGTKAPILTRKNIEKHPVYTDELLILRNYD